MNRRELSHPRGVRKGPDFLGLGTPGERELMRSRPLSVVCLVTLAISCGASSSPSGVADPFQEQKPIVIEGYSAPLRGPCFHHAVDVREGLELCRDRWVRLTSPGDPDDRLSGAWYCEHRKRSCATYQAGGCSCSSGPLPKGWTNRKRHP